MTLLIWGLGRDYIPFFSTKNQKDAGSEPLVASSFLSSFCSDAQNISYWLLVGNTGILSLYNTCVIFLGSLLRTSRINWRTLNLTNSFRSDRTRC